MNGTQICGPGEHAIYLTGRIGYVCTPDVPGDGLPWDFATTAAFTGAMIFCAAIIGVLVWLMIFNRGPRQS
jgi:prolipoprotein diacylglyceryltransferase